MLFRQFSNIIIYVKIVGSTFEWIVILIIQWTRSKKDGELQDKSVLYFQQKSGHRPLDWRITIHTNADLVRWSRWSERNVGAAIAPSVWLSTTFFFAPMASLGPPLLPYEEFFGLACIWCDSWKSKSQTLVVCGQAAAKYFFFTPMCISHLCCISQSCCICSTLLLTWTIVLPYSLLLQPSWGAGGVFESVGDHCVWCTGEESGLYQARNWQPPGIILAGEEVGGVRCSVPVWAWTKRSWSGRCRPSRPSRTSTPVSLGRAWLSSLPPLLFNWPHPASPLGLGGLSVAWKSGYHPI